MVLLIKMYRDNLTFLLCIVFVWASCEIVVIKRQKDRIYTGHVLFEVLMPMWSTCAQYCSRIKVCKSINFIAWNRTCQINDAEPGICSCELHESVGNSFVMASTFPEKLAGQCSGNDCNLNQTCVPIGKDYYCVPLPINISENFNTPNEEPQNVALGKMCGQSSTYLNEYAEHVVDGLANTHHHTKQDQTPYWWVDLGNIYNIMRIEVINRHTSGYRLHDLDIAVGARLDDMSIFAHYKGPAKNYEHLFFQCSRYTTGRYVNLTITKGPEFLHVAEVNVIACPVC